METIRGFRYRLYPDSAQRQALAETVGVARLVYNLALEQRRSWGARRYGGQSHRLGAKMLSRELSDLRREVPWIGAVSQTVQNQALLDLDRAYANFFEGRAGYPTPRRKYLNDSFRHVGREIGMRRISRRWSEVRLPKIGWVRYRESRPLAGNVRNATLRRARDGTWEISFACRIDMAELRTLFRRRRGAEEDGPATEKRSGKEPGKEIGAGIGIDRGVVVPYALSTGEKIRLPKRVKVRERAIRRARKALSRRRRGSGRHERARVRLSRLTAMNAWARAHLAHELAARLARNFPFVVLEALNIRAMTASARGTAGEPGANVRAKAGLNRVVLNVGWYQFEVMLAYKMEEAGGFIVKVAPHHTSQICSSCGERHANSRKSQALFVCEGCGATHNADINAARNILARGLEEVLGQACPKEDQGRRNTPSLAVEGSRPGGEQLFSDHTGPCEAATVLSPSARSGFAANH